MRRWHRWIGLLAGLPLALLGLSGSLLLFRDDIEKSRRRVPVSGGGGASLEVVRENVRRAYPDGHLLYLRLGSPVEAVVLPPKGSVVLVGVDPASARVLGLMRGDERSWMDRVARFHFNLSLGSAGRQANGVLALLLLLTGCTGGWLAIRNRRSWHSKIGLVFAPFGLVFGVSGAMFVWSRPPPMAPPQLSEPAEMSASLDALSATALGALPGATLSWIQFPVDSRSPVTLRLRMPGDWQKNGSQEVHLNPATGVVLRVDRLSESSLHRQLYVHLAALHFGEAGKGRFRWVLALAGLVPAVLLATGIGVLRRS